MELKDFRKINFFGWFTWKKLSQFLCLIFLFMFMFSIFMLKLLFFSPSNDKFPGVFTMAETWSMVGNLSRKALDKINVNVKKFLLRQISDFELVLHIKNYKKCKLNLSLFHSKNFQALFFPCILNIHLEKLIGHVWSLDFIWINFFRYILKNKLEKLIRHVRSLDVIWLHCFPIRDFYMVILS